MENPKTAQDVVQIIRQFYLDHSDDEFDRAENVTESRKLWSMLTALRGPDNGHDDLKEATTIPFRTAFFKEAAKSAGMQTGALVKSHSLNRERAKNFRLNLYTKASGIKDNKEIHFINHARLAFNAIGLKWEDINEEDYVKR